MKKHNTKGIFSILLAAVLVVSMMPAMAFAAETNLSDDIVILFTGDVHGQADENLGYAGLAAYENEKRITHKHVAIVDAGDAVSGSLLASVSNGDYIVEAMNLVGYTAAVPGVHEFDYGVSHFRNILSPDADYPYISCNFLNAADKSAVFSPYKLAVYGDKTVAYLGISDPQTMEKSSANFKNSDGTYAYSFCDGNKGADLYAVVQSAIDAAKASGADYVVAIGHLVSDAASPYSASAVIKNTSGINAFIQGNSHDVSVGQKVTDKGGNTVLLSCAGSGLSNIGQLVLSGNTITASAVNGTYNLRDITTKDGIEKLKTSYNADLSAAFASTSSRLEAADTKGSRTIDKKETNLGDLVADAFRIVTGADVGLVESKDIQASLAVGSMSYKDVTKVLPNGNSISVVEVSGADLMDALEMSARLYPNANGSFLQVSGLTYDIQETVIPTISLDGFGNFSSVTGEYRVTNVMVNGKELDLFGTYKIAGTEPFLNGTTGYTMFANGILSQSEVTTDNMAVITYISGHLRGSVGSLYAKAQGRVDSIKLARQSEIEREVSNLVKAEVKNLQTEVDELKLQLELANQALEIKSTTVTAGASYGKSSGKRYIKVAWSVDNDVEGMKYQIYKSSKKNSGYSKVTSTSKMYYKNTSGLSKGKTYYYKVRGYKTVGGKTYYTNWSNIVSKKVTS